MAGEKTPSIFPVLHFMYGCCTNTGCPVVAENVVVIDGGEKVVVIGGGCRTCGSGAPSSPCMTSCTPWLLRIKRGCGTSTNWVLLISSTVGGGGGAIGAVAGAGALGGGVVIGVVALDGVDESPE